MFDRLINRHPDNYKKNKESNIGKLYQIYSRELNQIKEVLEDIKKCRDVDKATHKTLDKIGKNVLELRSTDDDDLYRQMIKTKIIANLSQGDIETINEVAKTLVGNSYAGVEETWNNPTFDNEVSGLVMKLHKYNPDTPFKAFERVRAGGVRLFWELLNETTTLKLRTKYIKYEIPYPLCGTYNCGIHPIHAVDGLVLKGTGININTKFVNAEHDYPMTNETMTGVYPDYVTNGIEIEGTQLTVKTKDITREHNYPVTSENTVTKE